jgi:hypothetical protein
VSYGESSSVRLSNQGSGLNLLQEKTLIVIKAGSWNLPEFQMFELCKG